MCLQGGVASISSSATGQETTRYATGVFYYRFSLWLIHGVPPPLKDARPYSLFSYLFTVVGATFNYSATIWSLARGLIGLFLAISSGVGTMGNEVGDGGLWGRLMIQVERWGGRLCQRRGGRDRRDWERDWGRKMGCCDGQAPGEHQHDREEEQLKCFRLAEGKKGRQSSRVIIFSWLEV